MQWLKDNWIIVWPVATALASLLYKLFDKVPRVHAFFSLLASLGLDLPKLLETLQRLFSGAPPAPPAGTPKSATPKDTLEFPKKPSTLVRALAVAVPIALVSSLVVAATGSLAACANFWKDPVHVAEELAQYVTLFIQTAQTVWATIAPLLGANAAQDTAAFNDAVVVLQNANALMIDGAQAVAAGKTVNLPQLIQAVQDAVARVMAVITQFRTSTAAASSASENNMANLSHMAASIQHWQESK
jgi:hypothetical protein